MNTIKLSQEDLDGNFIDFLKKHFDVTKRPYSLIVADYTNPMYHQRLITLKDFLKFRPSLITGIKNLSDKQYISMCEDFKKLGFDMGTYLKPTHTLFEHYTLIIEKESKSKKKETLAVFKKNQRVSFMKKLIEDIEKRFPGYVKDEKIFKAKLEELKELIVD